MKMKILSGPQIAGPDKDGFVNVYVVAQVEETTPLGQLEKGTIIPVRISGSGTKDIPNIGEIVEVGNTTERRSGTSLVYRR